MPETGVKASRRRRSDTSEKRPARRGKDLAGGEPAASEAERAEKAPRAKASKPPSELRRVVRLLTTYSGGRRVYMAALFLLVIEAVSAIYQPWPIAYLIDFFRQDRPPIDLFNHPWLRSPEVQTLTVLTVGLVALTMLNSLADSLAEIRLAKGGRTLGFNTRQALYERLHRLSLAFHGHRRTGDMLTRVTSDVTAVEDFVIDSVSDLAGSFLVLIGTLTFLFYKSWQVAVVALLIVPLLSVISNYFSQRIKTASKRLRAREGDLASVAQEMLSSIRVVQTYGRSSYEERRFAEQSRSAMGAALEAASLKAKFSWVVAVMEAVAISAVAWLGLRLTLRPNAPVSVGTLVLFIILIQNMFKPTRKIIREWTVIGKIFAAVERIAEVLDREATVRDEPGAVDAPPFDGRVAFRHVDFSYQLDAEDAEDGDAETRVALRNVSFEIAAGQVVALVGASGAGKSTVAQLIPRLYDPDSGTVLVDGTDIRQFTLDSLRAQISVVLQETVLFSGTVAENIAYGREDATHEEVVEAARKANADPFVIELPDAYDTVLGERGANLSGGQRQRIAIARAFVRDAPILILDEPTTGLDAAAADQVVRGLETLMEGKTTIIISHDLHLVRDADLILVLEEGQVVQSGSHADLVARKGPYADFCARQGLVPVAGTAGTSTTADSATDDAAPGANGERTEGPEPSFVSRGRRRRKQPGRVLSGRMLDLSGPVPVVRPAAPTQGERPQAPPAVARAGSTGAGGDGADAGSDGNGRGKDGRGKDGRGKDAGGGGPKRVPALTPEFDPLTSPRLHEVFPGLTAALDPAGMTEALQRSLFANGSSATVVTCSPGKAMLQGDDGIGVRYALTVRDQATGSEREQLVLGRVFPDEQRARNYLHRLGPLVAALEGRVEQRHATTLTGAPEAVPGLVVHTFPIDGELPTLVGATDEGRMLGIFGKALGRSGLEVNGCSVELGAYGRRHRCVLRYSIDVAAQRSGRKGRAVVFGKVYSGDTGARVAEVVPAVSAHLAELGQDRLSVPSHLTYLSDLRLSLLNRVPGRTVIASILKATCLGQELEPGLPTALEAVDDAARVAASMHNWPTTATTPRMLADDMREMRGELRAMRTISPELASHLRDLLDEIERAGMGTRPGRLRFGHGDYSLAQLLHDGRSVALVDFDSACQAESALDLGHFLAYLRLSIAKSQTSATAGEELAQRLSWRFLDSYSAERGEASIDPAFEARVAVYKALSLMRITVHAWQKLKPARIALSLPLLEEEVNRL